MKESQLIGLAKGKVISEGSYPMGWVGICMSPISKIFPKILLLVIILSSTVFSTKAALKTASVTGAWSNTATWGGNPTPSAGDNIVVNAGVTLTVDIPTPLVTTVVINASGTANGITISGSNVLNCGAITMTAPTAAITSSIAVGSGTLNATSIAIPGSGTANRICLVSVSTGLIDLTGGITFSGTASRAQLTFLGAGTLNIGGNLGAGGTFTKNTGTVNCDGSAAQTVAGYNYNILKVNNTVGVSLVAATTITTLTIGDITSNSIFNDRGFVITPGASSVLNLTSGTYNLGSATTATTWPAWGTRNIQSGTTVGYVSAVNQTVSSTPTYSNLTFSNAGTKTTATNLIVQNNFNASGGSWTFANPQTMFVGGNFSQTVAGSAVRLQLTLNGTGDQTLLNTGGTNFNVLTINKASGKVTMTSNITSTTYTHTLGTFDASTFLLTAAATLTSGTLRVGDPTWAENYSFTPTPPANFTIEYYNNNPTINGAITYQNLQFSGTGTAGASAALTIQGNLTNTGGGALNFGGNNVVLSGNVVANNIAGYTTTGLTSLTKSAGIATFTGAVSGGALTIAGSGTGALNLGAGLTHSFSGNVTLTTGSLNGGSSTLNANSTSTTAWNGTGTVFSAGTGTVNFGGGNQTLLASTTTFNNVTFAGTGTKTLSSATVTNGDLNISGGVTLDTQNNLLTFGGDFVNGGTFTPGSSPIILNGGNAQSIDGFITTGAVSMNKTGGTATFQGNVGGAALNINGGGGTLDLGAGKTHTFTGNVTLTAGTLNGGSSNLNVNSSTTTAWGGTGTLFNAGTGTVTFGGTAQTLSASATTFNNVTFSGSGTKTLSSATVANGDLTISGGVTLATGDNPLTFGGDFVNGGTFTTGSSDITLSGGNSQSIDGFTTTGNVSMSKTGGTATLQGNTNGVALTINGAGGTLDLGAGKTHTFSGDVTLTAGTLSGNSSTLNLNSTSSTAWNGNGLLFTAGTGLVNFGGAAQTLSASATSFNDLTFSGSGIKTLSSATTIVDALVIASGVKVNLGNSNSSSGTLSLGGNGQPGGTWGGTLGIVNALAK